ncbi:MAG: hypothetical protein AAF918_12660 [Pseudomonadota bacterium]
MNAAQPATIDCRAIVDLNANCRCLPIDSRTLAAPLDATYPTPHPTRETAALFAETGLFLTHPVVEAMVNQVRAIEFVLAHPAHHSRVAKRSAAAYALRQGDSRGVLNSYDFHLTTEGPRLIEINTNAGGAALVCAATAALAQQGCRPALAPEGGLEVLLSRVFEAEWSRAGRATALHTIALVDDRPTEQFLYLDMQMIAAALNRLGYDCRIVDPGDLQLTRQNLTFADGTRIDFVYNRLTDFALDALEHENLRRALAQDLAVVSPSPRHHALSADKRNLIHLSDHRWTRGLDLQADSLAALATLPQTTPVDDSRREHLWQTRKTLFFKPAQGFASRAVYRGDKLTRRVWRSFESSDYIAQALVPPTTRYLISRGEDHKFDLRLFTDGATPLLLGGRLWRGQTTNFRTAGGGLAAVLEAQPDACLATQSGD